MLDTTAAADDHTGMKEALKIVAWAAVLALVTGLVGWHGFGWDGETDNSSWYVVFGLPFLATLIFLSAFGVHPAVLFGAAGLAQFLCCAVVVGFLRLAWWVGRLVAGAVSERRE